jgi:hypothetical protein
VHESLRTSGGSAASRVRGRRVLTAKCAVWPMCRLAMEIIIVSEMQTAREDQRRVLRCRGADYLRSLNLTPSTCVVFGDPDVGRNPDPSAAS